MRDTGKTEQEGLHCEQMPAGKWRSLGNRNPGWGDHGPEPRVHWCFLLKCQGAGCGWSRAVRGVAWRWVHRGTHARVRVRVTQVILAPLALGVLQPEG